jgi:phage gp36-like protein
MYCTQTEIENRITAADLVRLADQDGDGSADAAVVAQAIADACGHIDSYLGVLLAVPIVPTPDVLRKRAVSLSVYFLELGRHSVSEDTQKEYDRITQWLKDVVAGKATLGITATPAASGAAPGVKSEAKPRLFGRDEAL